MPFNPQRYQAPARVHLPDRRWPERALTQAPTWCSVDLRDGNQALPDPMGHERKRALLELLLRVGFKQIELGFPSASQTDFDFIRWALTSGVVPADVIPQVITQAREPLIVRTFESIVGAKRAIVHLYNSTSELQRRVVFGKSKQEILDLAVQGTQWVKRAAERMPETQVIFQYSPESFTGTELEYALEVCVDLLRAEDLGGHAGLGGEIGGALHQHARGQQVAGLVGEEPGGVDGLADDQAAFELGALALGDEHRGLTDAWQGFGGLEVAVVEVGEDDGLGRGGGGRFGVDPRGRQVDGDGAIAMLAGPQDGGGDGAADEVRGQGAAAGAHHQGAARLPLRVPAGDRERPAQVGHRFAP